MKFTRLLVFLALALWASPWATAQVKASLVGADKTIQPGQPFTVALRLQHDAHWHTYWVNPGTGLATEIAWELPPGFTAGPIQWPAPVALKDRMGNVIGNGYENDQLLPVTITPPADLRAGERITLRARIEWLMCKDVCMPGEADLELALPVGSEAPAIKGELGRRIDEVVAGLPRAVDKWSVAASRTAKSITLHVTPNGENNHLPTNLHFFADDNLVAYEAPQNMAADGSGGYALKLDISPDGPQDATHLIGVLTAGNGWLADGTLPGLRVEVSLMAAAAASVGDTPTLTGTLLLALVGGLILNLMPCVFPVLGIKILGFVNQAGSDRRKVAMHGVAFTIGVLSSFWVLAGALAVLRAGGEELGWGFQLQSPIFVYLLSVLLLVFALNMSGLFEFGMSAVGVGSGLQSKSGYSGSFFTGVLATVVATPCSAPFLAPALGAALALPVVQSFTIFTVIAIGLSTPYLLLSIFPGAIKILPRPGAWMETFKQFMAFPLYATVGYLVWVLAGQLEQGAMLTALIGLVIIAMGVWIYGRWNAPGASAGRAKFGLIAGLAVFAIGAWTGWPSAPDDNEVKWGKWSSETVESLRADDRTIYVDFTARWCATCQANKKLVFGDDEVLKYFADNKIVTLRGDWTNQDPLITAELAKYHRSAVPFNVIWMPGQSDPILLPELLTAGTVLDALKDNKK